MARPDPDGHTGGDPDVPEERNPRGRDSQPDPSAGMRAEGRENAAFAPAEAVRPPSKVDDAKFLADEFGIPETRAVAAVAGENSAQADRVLRAVHQRRLADDPLAGVPTPKPSSADLTRDADERALKPVIRSPNNRTGAG